MINIAIDGPSGAGKSTMAKIIAKENGYIYLDTGAMYRAFGLYVMDNGIALNDINSDNISQLLKGFNLKILYVDNQQQVIVNDVNVNDRIRTQEVAAYASKVAQFPEVRLVFVDIQREIAKNHNLVMDGRDIGSYVLKDADVKIFLTATVEDRARRRFEELNQKGVKGTSYNKVLEEMIERDNNDCTRAMAPLIKADDAIEINTTGLEIEQSLELIRKVIKDKLCGF